MKHILFFLLSISFFSSSYGQILEVDSILKQNDFTEFKNQNLILVDFWATWCGPCKPATKQLEIMQDLYSEKVFIISISDESNEIISKFLASNPIKLLVASDYNQKNINQYNVKRRPHAVLLDLNGNILWEGKPSDMTFFKLEQFIKNTKTPKQAFDFKRVISAVKKAPVFIPNDSAEEAITIREINKNTILKAGSFKGNLRDFISEYLNTPLVLIDSNDMSTKNYEITISKKYVQQFSKKELADSILNRLGLSLIKDSKSFNFNEVVIKNEQMLWDSTQILWGNQFSRYLIGETKIEADNVTIKELFKILSNTKRELYIYQGNNEQVYDWDFSYSFDNLLKDELKNSYGIELVKKKQDLTTYKIVKN